MRAPDLPSSGGTGPTARTCLVRPGRREALIRTVGMLVLGPYGCGRTKVPIEWRRVMVPDAAPAVGTAAQALRTAFGGRGVKERRYGIGHRRS